MKSDLNTDRRKLLLAAGMSLVPAGVLGFAPSSLAATSPSGGGLYPGYNTKPIPADASGMTRTATEIAARIRLGFNIGNTLEAIGGETAWGNPRVTKGLIKAIKANGFDAVRLPCAWDQYSDEKTARISSLWLDRIETIVQYCIDADLYVLLNIHWDGGWLENHIKPEYRDAIIAKQRAFWEQIATKLRDHDERLIFASANEPNCDTPEQMALLLMFHQTCIDAVRSTGGRNAYRTVVLQAPNTNTELAAKLWIRMPTDTVADRLMAEVHYYDPSQFTITGKDEPWGKMFHYWGKGHHSTVEPSRNATWGEEDYVDRHMALAKTLFVDKGIPVVVGEYGVGRRTSPADLDMHMASRAYWMKYVTQSARAHGLLPFVWDVGGIIDRRSFAVNDQPILDAVLEGAGLK